MYYTILAVALLAIFIGFLVIPDHPIEGTKPILGHEEYQWRTVFAPVSTGFFLDLFSRLTTSKFGPVVRRTLLNDNNIHIIRELAAQVTTPPIYFPVRRVLSGERLIMEEAAASMDGSVSAAIQNGFGWNASLEYCNQDRISIRQYHKAYLKGDHKPSTIMSRAIKVVREWESQGLRIFSSFIDEDIMIQAYESDKRYANNEPLSVFDGIPVAFKDMLNVRGHKIYDGKSPFDPSNAILALSDDTIVERFRALGAIIFGVTVMTEGGVTPLGYNAHFRGPHSAYSRYHYSGGSSSGSGVAVSTGLVPVAIGFDGGGSIRIPASMSGVHGLATTFHRCPYDNNTDGTNTKAGPLAASAEDAALAYAVMAPTKQSHFFTTNYDGGVQGPPPPHLKGFTRIDDLSDVRLGVYPEWFNDSDLAVRDICNNALQYLKSRGATIVNVTIPHLPWLSLGHGIKIASEFALAFDKHFHTRQNSLEPNTRITVGIGATVTALEVLAAEKLRAWGFDYVQDLFVTHNLTAIVTPTLPTVAPFLHPDARSHGESNTGLVMQLMKYIFLANFLGMPGHSIPVGFAEAGRFDNETMRLPVGLHLLGQHWHEDALLRIAHSVDVGYTCRQDNRPQPLFKFNPFGDDQ